MSEETTEKDAQAAFKEAMKEFDENITRLYENLKEPTEVFERRLKAMGPVDAYTQGIVCGMAMVHQYLEAFVERDMEDATGRFRDDVPADRRPFLTLVLKEVKNYVDKMVKPMLLNGYIIKWAMFAPSVMSEMEHRLKEAIQLAEEETKLKAEGR